MAVRVVQTTKTFNKLVDSVSENRKTLLQGGTWSGKTHSALDLIAVTAKNCLNPLVMSVVGETMPNIRKGAIRDFTEILGGAYDPKDHNKSESIFKFGDSLVEFFSADQPGKVHGPRRDWLYMNEAINIRKEAAEQMIIRTRNKVIMDFNPLKKFWAHDLIDDEETGFFKSTYKDNQFCPADIVKEIESRRGNENWYRVYGLGEIGNVEGLIFPNIKLIDEYPDIPTTLGLDFGFSQDYTSLVEFGFNGGAINLHEWIYERQMTNQDIARRMREIGVTSDIFIYADCAEPKSIEEIGREKAADGKKFLIRPCVKGPDSVRIGLDFLSRYPLWITKPSTNGISECRNFCWAKNKDGDYINIPEKTPDHFIAAVRYAATPWIEKPAKATGGIMKSR